MCKVQMLRALVEQRLTAAAEEIFGLFERTIAEYEEELSRSKEENERQQTLLEAVFKPQLRLHRAVFPADVQQLLVSKEEVPPEQQELSSSLDQEDPEPPHIKEEQEEVWTSQEGEQLQGLEEADITKFPFTPVPVKSEDDEEKPQSSQLHQRHTEHMGTEADGEDCGEPEPARNSDPDRHLQPDTEDKTEDSSEPETEDSEDEWKETRKPQSGLKSLKNDNVPVSDLRCSAGEKPFSGSVCSKRFVFQGSNRRHMCIHRGEKRFSCSVCDKRFTWIYQLKRHKCVGHQSSQLHQSQTEESTEAEPPASSATEQMETEADGEDCGGPEPGWNSDPERYLESNTDDKIQDSSEPETEDSKTREPQSGLNALKNEVPVSDSRCSAGEKPFSCSECEKRFSTSTYVKIHMRSHTGEKPFSCSECGKRFSAKGSLKRHMRIHTGEKSFSCSECGKRFSAKGSLKGHMRIHTGEKLISCSECGQRFSTKGNLKIHVRMIHSEEKPFSCSECGERFSTKAHLKRHMRIHTGEKPFSCPVCDRTFTWYKTFKRHKCVLQSSQLH